jgi:hypothetical protein
MTAFMTIAAIVVLGTVYVLLPVAAHTYRRLLGPRMVTCPETLRRTPIELDAKRGALTSTFGDPKLHVAKCTRWPEHRDCDQHCLKEVETTVAG